MCFFLYSLQFGFDHRLIPEQCSEPSSGRTVVACHWRGEEGVGVRRRESLL